MLGKITINLLLERIRIDRGIMLTLAGDNNNRVFNITRQMGTCNIVGCRIK